MTITNRLTVFFQVALGLVLVGFSLALHSLASWHLHAQADRHLQAAMDLLVASIEVHPADVEWEPLERKVTLGDSIDQAAVRWTIRDEAGELVDCSVNLAGAPWPDSQGEWRLLASQLSAGEFRPAEIDHRSIMPPVPQSAPLPDDRSATRSKFILTVGLLNDPIHAELLRLAITLLGVSVVTWVIAGIGVRWLCSRALWPVHQMARTVRQLQAVPDSDSLLTVPASNDELTDLSNAFNGLLGTLRASVERQARFAGDASHQLRTPLTATQTAVDVALRRDRSIEEYQRVLTIVQRRNRELTNIVETLLTLARQPAQIVHSMKVVELNRCCRERLDAMSAHARSADLCQKDSANPVFVQSDPLLVSQVVDNLLDNACKYSKPGTPVTVRVTNNENEAAVAVTDHGYGIASQELAQVFEPFFRSSEARWHGSAGIGLGLAIASRFAKCVGGRLEVKSELGVGSEFRLVLPILSEVLSASTDAETTQDQNG